MTAWRALAVACMALLATGQILTHSHWDDAVFRDPRWFLGGWDLWHLCSFLVNWPLPAYVWWRCLDWRWRLVALPAVLLPWVILRPAHWGPSMWWPF